MDSEERKYMIDIIESLASHTIGRLTTIIIILIAIIAAGVVGFVIREDKYAIERTEIEASTKDGGTVMANMMGVMTYGNRQDNNDTQSEEAQHQEDNK